MRLTIGHGLQAAVVGPAEPAGKKLLRRTDVRVVPEPVEALLQDPGAGQLEITLPGSPEMVFSAIDVTL